MLHLTFDMAKVLIVSNKQINFINNLILKIMKIVALISAGIGVLFMIFGAVNFLFLHRLFHVTHPQNFFLVAGSFLLLAIFCKLSEQD